MLPFTMNMAQIHPFTMLCDKQTVSKHLPTIWCPVGFSGYQCKEGKGDALREYECPQRVLTTTVRAEGGKRPVLPVRSQGVLPKGILRQCIRSLMDVRVKPPLRMGETVVANVLDTGIDMICTDDLLV